MSCRQRLGTSLGGVPILNTKLAGRALATTGLAGGLVAATLAAMPAAGAAGTINVSVRSGVLSVVGNDTGNVVRLVKASNGMIQVTANSRLVRRGAAPTIRNVREIRISTLGGNDTVRVAAGLPRATINGGAGNDSLSGGDGNDVMRGGAGNDEIHGGNGDDVVLGDAGNDFVSGQAGDDRVQGGAGNDTVIGQAGDDILRGDAGDDLYQFDQNITQGSDVLVEGVGAGTDGVRFLGTTAVSFSLASTTDQVISPTLSVRLSSSDAFENAVGGFGNDTLIGNGVGNRLNGGGGDDHLTGAGGADVIVPGDGFGDVIDEELMSVPFGHDTVTDFTADDTVDLYADQTVTTMLPASTVSISGTRDSGQLTTTEYLLEADDFS